MINSPQYILGITASVITLLLVVEMLRRRRLRERHATWWLIAGIIAVITSIFPESLIWLSKQLGFELPVNLVFFGSLLILFLVVLQLSAELTKVEGHNRLMAEEVALLDLRIQKLEPKEPNDS